MSRNDEARGDNDRRQVRLSRVHKQFLEQERKRLKLQYGINVSLGEMIEVLIEQHRMRVIQMAAEDQESVIWFYRKMKELPRHDRKLRS